MLIDTHAHLTDARFAEDLDAVLRRAGEAGVGAVLDVGDGVASSAACVEHARRRASVFAAVGIHPHGAAAAPPDALERIAELSREEGVVALGEAGLDFYRCRSPREAQERMLRGTLGLAAETGLPVVLHCREAYAALIAILREEGHAGIRGVVHCFSGSPGDAEALLGRGYSLGFGGTLTYPANGGLRELARALPLGRILLETDCPYLPPEGERGKRNEPAFVARVHDELARLRGVDPGEVARATTENALRLFAGMGAGCRGGGDPEDRGDGE